MAWLKPHWLKNAIWVVMDYKITIDTQNKLVVATCEGELNVASAKPLTRALRSKAFDLGYNCIYDVRRAFLNASILDAYQLPRSIDDLYENPLHKRGKAAIVYESDKEFWEFLETTALNSGVLVKVFIEKEAAIEWLSSPFCAESD